MVTSKLPGGLGTCETLTWSWPGRVTVHGTPPSPRLTEIASTHQAVNQSLVKMTVEDLNLGTTGQPFDLRCGAKGIVGLCPDRCGSSLRALLRVPCRSGRACRGRVDLRRLQHRECKLRL